MLFTIFEAMIEADSSIALQLISKTDILNVLADRASVIQSDTDENRFSAADLLSILLLNGEMHPFVLRCGLTVLQEDRKAALPLAKALCAKL
jgi:hypothetical protein